MDQPLTLPKPSTPRTRGAEARLATLIPAVLAGLIVSEGASASLPTSPVAVTPPGKTIVERIDAVRASFGWRLSALPAKDGTTLAQWANWSNWANY